MVATRQQEQAMTAHVQRADGFVEPRTVQERVQFEPSAQQAEPLKAGQSKRLPGIQVLKIQLPGWKT